MRRKEATHAEVVPSSRGLRAILACALASASGMGCSLLLHSDASQCSNDSDCAARGFANTTCEVTTGTCVAQTLREGGADAEHDGGDGGEPRKEGGRESGAETGGDTGTDGGTRCQKTADCPVPTESFGSVQVACDVDTHTCVSLTSMECPFVIGDLTNVNAPPVFIGAFATIPASGPMAHPSFLNYELALDELANNGDGISIGSGLRTPVAVVCSDESDPNVVMPHLINDVHIAVLVAALNTTTLLTAFSNVNDTDASAPTVLFINPFGSDDLFAPIQTQGLLWSLLGQPADVTQAYQAFFPWVEAYVRRTQNLTAADGGAPPSLRIATVTSNSADTQQLSLAVQKALDWNALGTNYIDVKLQYSSLNAGYTLSEGTTEATAAAQALADFRPNIVVSFGSEEFVSTVEVLDGFDWSTSTMGPKPFYVVGPYNEGSPTLTAWIGSDDSKRVRLAGINFASAPATDPVLSTYTNDFVMTFPQAPASATAYNNYYDAMYFAVYSLAGAANVVPLTGTAAAGGMIDLTYASPPGASVDMGAASIATVESTLTLPGTLSKISLNGTLGPPDFNQKTGDRVGQGDVYCVARYPEDAGIDDAGNTLALQPYYVNDVLRLEAADGGSPADGGVPDLEGTFPCFDGMAPP